MHRIDEADSDRAVDVVIVGGGPGGLAAALALGRATKRVLLCDAGAPRNAACGAVMTRRHQHSLHPSASSATARGTMTTPSIRHSSRSLRWLAHAHALFAFTALVACDERSAALDDVSEDDAQVVQGDAGDASIGHDSGLGQDLPPWDEATPALVDVSGRAVEVVEGGAGNASVIFESGLGNDWTPWDEVAGKVAARARVFAYSRPGYGQSDPSTEPRNATRIIEELRALLLARGFAPPYVLVGHSFGGTYVELFAKAHPEEVAGLVLVESRHRDFAAACEAEGLDGCSIPASVVATLPQVERAEIEAFAGISGEIRASGRFGKHPVRVLTATSHGFAPKVEALWESLHGSLAKEAAHGEQIFFTGASHNLPTERGNEVAEVILSLIPASNI